MADLENLTDRDLLVQIATEQRWIVADVAEIKIHAKETNGHITELKAEHYRQAGAIIMLRWLGGLTLAGIGAGGTIAGVVLAIVARGT